MGDLISKYQKEQLSEIITIRLTPSEADLFRKYSCEYNISASQAIRFCIRYFLQTHGVLQK